MEQKKSLSPDEEALYVALQTLDMLVGSLSCPIKEGVRVADALGHVARCLDKLLHTHAEAQLKEHRLEAKA